MTSHGFRRKQNIGSAEGHPFCSYSSLLLAELPCAFASFSTQLISMTVTGLTLQVRTSSGGSVSRTADDAPKGDVPKISQRSEVSTAGDGALPEHWCLGSKPTVIIIQAERAQIASGITPRPQILRMAVHLMTCAAASKFGCLGLGVSSADFSKLPNQKLER